MNEEKIFISSHAVIKKDGKILLGIRAKKNNSPTNGKYFTVGGTLEFLETAENCLHREVKEETNIEIKNVKFVKFYEYIDSENKFAPHKIVFVYTANYKSGELKGDDDCVEPQFFTKEEIKKLIAENKVADFVIKVLKDMKEI